MSNYLYNAPAPPRPPQTTFLTTIAATRVSAPLHHFPLPELRPLPSVRHLLCPMESGGIYIALWRRPAEAGNTSINQTFHWGLVIARNPTGRDSLCCHVVGGQSTWAYETKEPYNALQSLLALRFCRIGCTDDINRTVRIVENVPVPVDSKTFTCRTWTMDAVGELNKAGIVLCRDIGGLECELWQLGASAILAEQQDRWSITDIRWAHSCRHPPYS